MRVTLPWSAARRPDLYAPVATALGVDQRALLDRYLSRLASGGQDQAVFNACIDDLLSLPDMAGRVRAALRDPAQADSVRAAFGRLLAGGHRTGPKD